MSDDAGRLVSRGSRESLLPVLAAAASGILVGSGIVATRSVVDQAGPGSIAFMRYLIGVCCLLPPALLSGRPRFERRDLLPMALLGITQFGILVVLLNYGLQFIPSARSALIFATMPLLTMLFGAAIRTEAMTVVKTLGVLLTIVGVGFAIGEKAILRGGSAGEWVGELATFASALSGAVCSVLYRPYLRKYPTLPVSAFAMLAAVAFLSILAMNEGYFNAWPAFTYTGWLAILFIGVNSGAGYYLWLWALGHTTPTRVTVFLALSPITAAWLGIVFLDESLSAMSLLGLAFVALGLWFAHRQKLS